MRKIIKVSLLVLILFIHSCAGRQQNLDYAKLLENEFEYLQEFNYLLDELLDDDTIKMIKNMKSPNEMIEFHFSIGQYIRNYWIRHGSPELQRKISFTFKWGNFNFAMDDISGFILENYWHYLHNKKFDIIKEYEQYGYSYLSTILPEINEKRKDEIENKMTNKVYYRHNKLLYYIHVYKIKHSNEYYTYDMIRGWEKINDIEYKSLIDEWNQKNIY